MTTLYRIITIGTVAAMFTLAWLNSQARAHEATAPDGTPTGWHYDAACCGNQDCAPISGALIDPNGRTIYQNRFGAGPVLENHTTIRQSKDQHTHACFWNGRLWCLYVPGGS